MRDHKREIAQILGVLTVLCSILVALAGPNLVVAAERGRAPSAAPALAYGAAAIFAAAGIGLVFLQRWAGAAVVTLSVAFVVVYLVPAASDSSPSVFILNLVAAAFLLIPAAIVRWAWPALRGGLRPRT